MLPFRSPKAFDEDMHFSDGGPLTAQYLLVVDALNFCFWPGGCARALPPFHLDDHAAQT